MTNVVLNINNDQYLWIFVLDECQPFRLGFSSNCFQRFKQYFSAKTFVPNKLTESQKSLFQIPF